VSAPRRRKKNPLGGLLEEWKRRLRGSAEVVNAENSLKEVEARNSELVKSVKTLRLRKSMVARLKSELEQVDRELEVFGV
jgi:SMC interacting uncharacterized protein involved in chromosome segregation